MICCISGIEFRSKNQQQIDPKMESEIRFAFFDPKSPEDASQDAARRFGDAARRSKMLSRRPQETTRRTQDGPTRRQDGSKTAPRQPQDGPKRLPRRAQERPKIQYHLGRWGTPVLVAKGQWGTLVLDGTGQWGTPFLIIFEGVRIRYTLSKLPRRPVQASKTKTAKNKKINC